jgi:LmbE family N-acetylglucosaminyl deacetylase
MRVLVVFAHPDDAEFTCGGTVARWAAQGAEILYVACTDGEKGSHDPEVRPTELARIRRAEQRSAAESLGVKEVLFLGHPDGELEEARTLKAELTRLIRRFRPRRVLAWDPWRRYELHPDHRAAGRATLDAVLAAGNPHYFPEQRAEGLAAHQVLEVYLYGAEEPDTWVDITATLERKLAAIACHRSQVERMSHLMEDIRRCNAEYGRQGGSTYAEAFKVLYPFCDT